MDHGGLAELLNLLLLQIIFVLLESELLLSSLVEAEKLTICNFFHTLIFIYTYIYIYTERILLENLLFGCRENRGKNCRVEISVVFYRLFCFVLFLYMYTDYLIDNLCLVWWENVRGGGGGRGREMWVSIILLNFCLVAEGKELKSRENERCYSIFIVYFVLCCFCDSQRFVVQIFVFSSEHHGRLVSFTHTHTHVS